MMIFSKVFESYPNHRLVGIESVYHPGSGWTDYNTLTDLMYEWPTHDKFLKACHQRGATHVQLIIQDNYSKAIRWTDFSLAELGLK
jgi:hypothetical protein